MQLCSAVGCRPHCAYPMAPAHACVRVWPPNKMPMLCVQGRPSPLFWVEKSVHLYNTVLYVVLHIESRVIMCISKYF